MNKRLLLFLVLGSLPLFANQQFGPIHVTYEPIFPDMKPTSHGYVDLRFRLTNQSLKAHRVTLLVGDERQRWSYLNRLNRTVEIGPGATALVSMRTWGWGLPGNVLQLEVDGARIKEKLNLGWNTYFYNQPNVTVLSGDPVDWQAEFEAFSSGTATPNLPLALVHLPVAQWPEHWLDYAAFDLIVVRGDQWGALASEAREALDFWVRNGGHLVFVGKPKAMPEVDSRRSTEREGFHEFYLGFGLIRLLGDAGQPLVGAPVTYMLEEAYKASLIWTEDVSEAEASFPIVTRSSGSMRGFFALMLVIVLVIGPLNLWVLHRRGKRIWLLATVPVLALTASVCVFLYALVSEGFGTHLRRASLTILDVSNHLATTIGRQGIYATLTSGEGLHYRADTDVQPLDMNEADRFRTVDLSRDRHLLRGWLVARVPLHLHHRTTEIRRERLVIATNGEGEVTLTNGLGEDVIWLRYVDWENRLWQVENLAAGETQTASLSAEIPQAESPESLSRIYREKWFHKPFYQGPLAQKGQNPGTWLAKMKRSPFGPPEIEGVDTRKEEAYIYAVEGRP